MEVNQSEILKDLQLEVVILDDASKPEQAASVASRAAADPEIIVAIGHYNTPCALAAQDIYRRAGLPNMVFGIGSKITLEQSTPPTTFMVPMYDKLQTKALSDYAVNSLGIKSAYLLDDGTAYGKPMADAWQSDLAKNGIMVVGRESYAVGDRDFGTILARVREADPDALLVASVPTEAGLLRSQMVRLGLSQQFIGTSGIHTDIFVRAAGPSAEDTISPWLIPAPKDCPGGAAFEKSYQAMKFSEPAEVEGIPAYSATQAITVAIKKGARTRSDIMQALRTQSFDVAQGKMKFDEHGNNIEAPLVIYRYKNGDWLPLKTLYHRDLIE
jgi:branched-chain amino acid transport system substrate-binding protein